MEYKDTLKLPQTEFPMKANLPQREPIIQQRWEEANVYQAILHANKDCPTFLLHDGPPFANGDAHMGHALNMALKDFVLKSRNMEGKYSPFIPGWDCHGLPIEHKVIQEFEKQSKGAQLAPAEIRTRCEAYAHKYIDIQRTQFKRLGVFGEWDRPYLTMAPEYEAEQLRGLAKIIDDGLIYQGLRPVYWSTGCQTALAEAEVEYQDRRDTSIYVSFPIVQGTSSLGIPLPTHAKLHLLIWTTTPWTLPANLAVAYHENLTYQIGEAEGNYYIFVNSRRQALEKIAGKSLHIIAELKGSQLAPLQYQHPFLNRSGNLYPADFVTAESGTGLVHIAPGHGQDDYVLGTKHGLTPLSPVDDAGKLTEECGLPELVGTFVFKANDQIVQLLQNKNLLWASEEYLHSYPHCWRSKTPIVFRCVKQWFIRVDALRQQALDAIDTVSWVPSWGMNRIRGAVETRPDWCISRQRTWGVPIPVFYKPNAEPILNGNLVRNVADLVEQHGTNIWFSTPDAELASRLGLPPELTKGTDTLDVWIDSGSSHATVLKKRLSFPADLYLEGSDQHRGWFQSSLFISIALHGKPPYKEVVTNGFVVDMDGKKLSKSNTYQKPTGLMDFVNQYGADILRLWVASQDYRDDVPFSQEIFKRITDTYRLFRNTLRILLGNLHQFNPTTDSIPPSQWTELDLYIIHRLQDLITKVRAAYQTYEFHQVYHAINRFCAVELSALYIDVLKDRIYCDSPTSTRRRAAQTAIHQTLETLCKLLAPIIPYTSEETWQHLHGWNGTEQPWPAPSIHTTRFPTPHTLQLPPHFEERWQKLLALRSTANEQLEKARQEKTIGKSLEAALHIQTNDFTPQDIPLMEELFIVSQIHLQNATQTTIQVTPAQGHKCTRCWRFDTLGSHPAHPELCPRCTAVILQQPPA